MEKRIENIVEISIDGTNVTSDISAYLSKITYTDRIDAESDDVSIELDDSSGVWQSDWYPQKGDSLEIKIKSQGAELDCGVFEIDETEFNLSPDVFNIKAIAASISKSLRTRNSKAFENQTLSDIAEYFASKHGLELVGDADRLQDITIDRKTQEDKTDMAFLAELAKDYALLFSVREDQLVFMSEEELEQADAALVLEKSDLSSGRFRDKTSQTFTSAVVASRNSRTNSVARYEVDDDDSEGAKQDVLVIKGKAENEEQAKAVAEAALRNKNKDKVTGSVTIPGNVLAVAGINIELNGVGDFSGKWHVVSTKHSLTKNAGYTTEMSIRKID